MDSTPEVRTTTNDDDIVSGIACGLTAPHIRRQVEEALQSARSKEQVRQVFEAASAPKRREAEEIFTRCKESGIRVLSRLSVNYPELLHSTSAPPSAIYVRGNGASDLFSTAAIAMVGTRSASVSQCEAAKHFASELANHGVTVISGLALGIDGAAHRGVLQSAFPSRTIAVLAHGLDMVYPPSHTRLAESIVAAGGIVLSEYPPGVEARKHHFLERNRIIAGLSRGVVVFQAGERSGSLVTARFAADYGRDVFVVLGGSTDGDNAGGCKLADEGAQVVASARDVLHEYGLVVSGTAGCREYSISDFAALFPLSPAQVLALELKGVIVRLPGGRVLVSEGALPVKTESTRMR